MKITDNIQIAKAPRKYFGIKNGVKNWSIHCSKFTDPFLFKMDKENKKQICEILKSKVENQAAEIELMRQADTPQRILKSEVSILERRKKLFDSYCNNK